MSQSRRFGRRAKGLVLSAVTALLASAGVVASSVPAQAATYYNVCGQRVTSQAFKAYSDTNEYFLPQEGGFEASWLNGWVASNATIVTGNSPYYLTGNRSDSRSLKLNAGGSVISQVICVIQGEDSIRFAYRSPGVSGATLRVDISVLSALGTAYSGYTLTDAGAGWKISPRMAIPNKVDYTGGQSLKIKFTATGTSAAWQVDDVFVDPWRTL
ncbi:MAG: hypothetical protein U0Q19_21105 [Kineosporiaceae bacterium]